MKKGKEYNLIQMLVSWILLVALGLFGIWIIKLLIKAIL